MKTFHKLMIAGFFCASAALPVAAHASGTADQATAPDIKLAAAAGDMSDGEIRKIDKDQGKVTLKHGPIKNLDMPPMTMVFTVKDKAMLDSIKPGDKVKFRAEDANGKITVVEMMPTK